MDVSSFQDVVKKCWDLFSKHWEPAVSFTSSVVAVWSLILNRKMYRDSKTSKIVVEYKNDKATPLEQDAKDFIKTLGQKGTVPDLLLFLKQTHSIFMTNGRLDDGICFCR